jgi:hypothetical protein
MPEVEQALNYSSTRKENAGDDLGMTEGSRKICQTRLEG